MRSITELLKAEENNEPLTEEEKKYLDKFRERKTVRHATGFIFHSRRLPKEDDGRAD